MRCCLLTTYLLLTHCVCSFTESYHKYVIFFIISVKISPFKYNLIYFQIKGHNRRFSENRVWLNLRQLHLSIKCSIKVKVHFFPHLEGAVYLSAKNDSGSTKVVLITGMADKNIYE